jgi:recombinational DNA repair ATPase RecF
VLFARFDEKDLAEVSLVLDTGELSLFLRMSVADRRHSLDVYHAVCEHLQKHGDSGLNSLLLKRAALLHDVGKSLFQISIIDRVLATFPQTVLRIFFFWRLNHVCAYRDKHPTLSAGLIADNALAELALKHQEPPSIDDSPELVILKKIDRFF